MDRETQNSLRAYLLDIQSPAVDSKLASRLQHLDYGINRLIQWHSQLKDAGLDPEKRLKAAMGDFVLLSSSEVRSEAELQSQAGVQLRLMEELSKMP